MAKLKSKNIFINCPYDDGYVQTLRPLIFAVRFLGFNPRLAMESADSGAARINKIHKLIKSSRYAIHDLSRMRATRQGEHFRFNMPFELGLDIGCREYGNREQRRKRCLVLEKDKYSLNKALSDLSSSDVVAHKDDPETAVRHVRNWLVQETKTEAASGTAIWYAFNDFMADLDEALLKDGFLKKDVESLPLPEMLGHMTMWIGTHRGQYVK